MIFNRNDKQVSTQARLMCPLSVNPGEWAIVAVPILMYGEENGDSTATKELVI